ncbi:hypothetical protein OEM_27700 [Mycobacterium intracellulare subsp. yongonense 05-1390]|nr:hypothetical protein OEM_27700 [Mycobacterium intracellulare subsp. yongonense 05-1390]ETZ54774.1 hypothetical protein L840_4318 [Mycobacterium sp. MAC_011194_8550]ETZ69167.1 hypothetical protein L841_1370 [Mycobacterium sp. MAC_080597_8934]
MKRRHLESFRQMPLSFGRILMRHHTIAPGLRPRFVTPPVSGPLNPQSQSWK